jgi:hypothetical protein
MNHNETLMAIAQVGRELLQNEQMPVTMVARYVAASAGAFNLDHADTVFIMEMIFTGVTKHGH